MVYSIGNTRRFQTSSGIHMTMEKNSRTYDWSSVVEYDEDMRFFSAFDVGYIGKVEVLREIK